MRPHRLVHDRERVRGQHVLAREHGQQYPVARLESAAAAQCRRNRDVGLGRHGDKAARVPAGDHHARRGGKGQPVTRAPPQDAGDGPVGDPARRVDAAEPVQDVTGSGRNLGSDRQGQPAG